MTKKNLLVSIIFSLDNFLKIFLIILLIFQITHHDNIISKLDISSIIFFIIFFIIFLINKFFKIKILKFYKKKKISYFLYYSTILNFFCIFSFLIFWSLYSFMSAVTSILTYKILQYKFKIRLRNSFFILILCFSIYFFLNIFFTIKEISIINTLLINNIDINKETIILVNFFIMKFFINSFFLINRNFHRYNNI